MSNVDSSDSEDAYEMEEHDMEEEERPEDRSWNPEDYAYKGDLRMEKPHPDRPPVAPEYMRPANSGMSHNTGPKGVKADYEAAKMNLIGTRLREKVALERRIQRHALGDEKIVLKEQEEVSVGPILFCMCTSLLLLVVIIMLLLACASASPLFPSH